MQADKNFSKLPLEFWSHIKLVSEGLGYSDRGSGQLKIYSEKDIVKVIESKGLQTSHLSTQEINGKSYLSLIHDYCKYRAEVLNNYVQNNLMNRDQAETIFNELFKKIKPKSKMIENKQKGEKRHKAYLTGIVTMLTEYHLEGKGFNEDPQSLTIATENSSPVRTFTRRFDGIYPDIIDPVAVWEIKEYYGTTTFGSRVADGVYETLLDGYEFKDLLNSYNHKILHYLIVDDHFTWWVKGRSYLCRMIDMLNMGFVDEVIFGKEILDRWPLIVKSWITK